MIILFLSIISLVLALVHFVIYKAVVSIFVLPLPWRLATMIVLTVLCLSFVLASVLTFYFNNLFTRVFYTISATWLGFSFYLFLVSCIYALALWILPILNIGVSLRLFGTLFFFLAILVGLYGAIHARNLTVKNVQIALPQIPEAWKGKKAVWISDIHLGAVYDQAFATKIVNKINEINPDVIFIGGDLYDGVKVDEPDIIKSFANLHPKLGTYFITGNHEEFRDNKIYLDAVKSVGIHVLNNEMVEINGLQLVGVDDRESINLAKFKSILASLKIDKNKPTILLKHQPLLLEEADQAGVSLQISGHTHKAQVFPLNIFTKLIFKDYDYGLSLWGKMIVYTSSGVGTWGPPLRVGSDSEIVVFTFI